MRIVMVMLVFTVYCDVCVILHVVAYFLSVNILHMYTVFVLLCGTHIFL